MDYSEFDQIRQNHVGFRLLRATSFPFIASFFWKSFTQNNVRVVDEESFIQNFEDHKYRLSPELSPPSAKDAIRSWVETGYLRQYYVEGDDIPRYELTPETEKALDWVYSLRARRFVGTESRLKSIYELLCQIREQTEVDQEKRIALLAIERQKIDDEIARVASGQAPILSKTQIKERIAHLEDMARQLIRDFSEVEQNFRKLDQETRRKIASLDGSRGEVLGTLFQETDTIRESEQGRSFESFFEFLMTPGRQLEFDELLDHLYRLDERSASEVSDPFLTSIQIRLLDASDKIRQTQNILIGQLRRFLDDKQRLENTRIHRLIHELEQQFLNERLDIEPAAPMSHLDEQSVDIDIPARSLYRIPLKIEKQKNIREADHQKVSAKVLFAIDAIDERKLLTHIRRCLENQSPVSLEEILKRFPPEQGLAELVAYLRIASNDAKASISSTDSFKLEMTAEAKTKFVNIPVIYFSR